MWHRYAKRTTGWLCPSSSRWKEVRGQLRRDRGRTLGTMCTCDEIERGTHACKASKLGPVERWWTQDGKLGITIQDPPPESGRWTHLLYFYLFVLHSVTCLKTCQFAACFTILWTSISIFYVNTARDVVCCFVLLNRYWGIVMYDPGVSLWASQGRCNHDPRSPTSQPHPVPPLITWGVWILTLRLNYVASYTGPLLFLFDRTYNYYVDNQGLVPWRLRHGFAYIF